MTEIYVSSGVGVFLVLVIVAGLVQLIYTALAAMLGGGK